MRHVLADNTPGYTREGIPADTHTHTHTHTMFFERLLVTKTAARMSTSSSLAIFIYKTLDTLI